MMRLHKLCHRLTLPFSPLSLPSNPSLIPLIPPLRLTLRNGTVPNFASMASSRLRNLAPLAAAPAEDANAVRSVSSSANAVTSLGYEEESTIGVRYRVPPPEIRDIVDAPPVPALSFSPLRDKIIFLKRRALPPLAEIARPEESWLVYIMMESAILGVACHSTLV